MADISLETLHRLKKVPPEKREAIIAGLPTADKQFLVQLLRDPAVQADLAAREKGLFGMSDASAAPPVPDFVAQQQSIGKPHQYPESTTWEKTKDALNTGVNAIQDVTRPVANAYLGTMKQARQTLSEYTPLPPMSEDEEYWRRQALTMATGPDDVYHKMPQALEMEKDYRESMPSVNVGGMELHSFDFVKGVVQEAPLMFAPAGPLVKAARTVGSKRVRTAAEIIAHGVEEGILGAAFSGFFGYSPEEAALYGGGGSMVLHGAGKAVGAGAKAVKRGAKGMMKSPVSQRPVGDPAFMRSEVEPLQVVGVHEDTGEIVTAPLQQALPAGSTQKALPAGEHQQRRQYWPTMDADEAGPYSPIITPEPAPTPAEAGRLLSAQNTLITPQPAAPAPTLAEAGRLLPPQTPIVPPAPPVQRGIPGRELPAGSVVSEPVPGTWVIPGNRPSSPLPPRKPAPLQVKAAPMKVHKKKVGKKKDVEVKVIGAKGKKAKALVIEETEGLSPAERLAAAAEAIREAARSRVERVGAPLQGSPVRIVDILPNETVEDAVIRDLVQQGRARHAPDGTLVVHTLEDYEKVAKLRQGAVPDPMKYDKLKSVGAGNGGDKKNKVRLEVRNPQKSSVDPVPPQIPEGVEWALLPEEKIRAAEAAERILSQGRFSNSKAAAKIKARAARLVFDYHHLVPERHEGAAIRIAGTRTVAQQRETYLKQIHRVLKGSDNPTAFESELHRDLNSILRSNHSMLDFEDHLYGRPMAPLTLPDTDGPISWRDFEAKYKDNPEVMEAVPALKSMWLRVQRNQAELARRGLLASDAVEAQLDGVSESGMWLPRMYKRYLMGRRNWIRRIDGSDMRRWVEAAMQTLKRQGKETSMYEVEAILNSILDGSPQDAAVALRNEFGYGTPSKHLRKRKDLEPWMREMLGEIVDGTYTLAHGLAMQDALLARHRAIDDIVERGMGIDVFAPGDPNTPQGFIRVGAGEEKGAAAKKYGALNGKMVSPAVAGTIKAVHEASLTDSKHLAKQLLRGMEKAWKFSVITVGSGGPQYAQLVQSFLSSVVSGATTPFSRGSAKYRDLFKRAMSNDLTKQERQLVDLAREYGIDTVSFGQLTMQDESGRFARNLLNTMEVKNGESFVDSMYDALAKTGHKASDIADKLSDVQDIYLDRMWKFVAFMDLHAKGVKKGLDTDAAAEKAAVAIKRYYTDLSNPGALARVVSDIPFIGNIFIRPAMDAQRMLYFAAKDAVTQAMQGDYEMVKRISKLVSSLVIFHYGSEGMVRLMGGDPEAIKASQSEYQQRAGWRVVMPLKTAEDQFIVLNLSTYFDAMRAFSGPPGSNAVERVLASYAMLPFENSLTSSFTGEFLENTTGLPTIQPDFVNQRRLGELGAKQFMSQTGIGAMKPFHASRDFFRTRAGQQLMDTQVGEMIREHGGEEILGMRKPHPMQEPLSPATFAARLIQPKLEPVGARSKTAALQRVQRNINRLMSEYRQALKKAPTRVQKQRIKEEFEQRLRIETTQLDVLQGRSK